MSLFVDLLHPELRWLIRNWSLGLPDRARLMITCRQLRDEERVFLIPHVFLPKHAPDWDSSKDLGRWLHMVEDFIPYAGNMPRPCHLEFLSSCMSFGRDARVIGRLDWLLRNCGQLRLVAHVSRTPPHDYYWWIATTEDAQVDMKWLRGAATLHQIVASERIYTDVCCYAPTHS